MKRRTTRALSKIFICVGMFISVPCYARADEKPVKMKNLPKAVQQTVEEQSKGATILGLSRETENGKTYYEVELKVNGHHKDVLIDATGAVVESEEEVEVDALPAAVKSAIEKVSGKGKIVMVESITRNGSIVAYEAHIKNGRKTKEIKVGTDGELIKD